MGAVETVARARGR